MKHLIATLAAITAVSHFPNMILADTFEIVAIADATVESNGVNGQEILHDEESIRTSMSGGSNICDGLYEFDLSILPAGATITSATLNLRTSNLITNTNSESEVEFFVLTGNGVLEIADQGAAATSVATEIFATGTPADTDLEVDFTSVAVLNSVISDGNSDDYLTVRTETENFVLFLVHSLESTDTAAVPASLTITFTDGFLLGDVNRDCSVNLLDVDPFIQALSSGTYVAQADVNEDGQVDLLDVAPFIEILSGN